jgi:hypothetical protein
MTDDEVARIIYDGVIGQWLPGMVRDALAANFDPRPIAAALAARRPATEAEQAVERCRRLAADFDANGNGQSLGDPCADTWHKAANLLRTALDGAARDGSDG